MIRVFDSHAHLTDPRFAGDVHEVISRARERGVQAIVTIASNVPDGEAALRLAEMNPHVYATVGIHPHHAGDADDAAFERIRHTASLSRVVAIGETGLDYHYDNAERGKQRHSFRRHLELAEELDLPIVVHARAADEDVANLIAEAGWSRGVLHCFSSGPELLQLALSLGWYISFSGMITFPRWEAVDLLRSVPLERLLLETDSPYLAPVPHRGKRNEPANVVLVAEKAAELRGEDLTILTAATTANALNFYRIS